MNAKMGFILIDLTSLPLELGEESIEIEDETILKQLLELSDIALHSERQLKPVYIRTLDKNGIEIATLTQLGRNAGTLAILGDINFNRLVILVSYDVDEETSEVSIDSATLLYSEVKSGTKLYRHHYKGDGENYEIVFYSNVNRKIENSDFETDDNLFILKKVYNDDAGLTIVGGVMDMNNSVITCKGFDDSGLTNITFTTGLSEFETFDIKAI